MDEKNAKKENQRARKIRLSFRVDSDELKFIKAKMNVMHIKNREAYLRKMAIDGECIRYDYSEYAAEIRKNNYLLSNVSNNINQIARRVNSTGNVYDEDIKSMIEILDVIWEQQKKIMRLFLKHLP